MDWNKLTKPFDDKDVFWRIDRAYSSWARVLCYLDARAVMDRLDEAVGPENWQDKYFETASGKNMCELSIKIDGEWVTKSDGAGNTNIEGDKGGISDAFKRAAVKWGIGRHLYSLGETKVNLSPEKPYVEKHYLVVCAKRGQTTTYGVAPSLRKLQPHLYGDAPPAEKPKPEQRKTVELPSQHDLLLDVKEILIINKIEKALARAAMAAAMAKRSNGKWVSGPKPEDINPREMSIEELASMVQAMRGLDEAGMLKSLAVDYLVWIGA
tara:strand:- start:10872 stop:11672 length:801 start_codon:yes stop_codon:yes gene_type:complete